MKINHQNKLKANKNILNVLRTDGSVELVKTESLIECFCISPEGKIYYSTSSDYVTQTYPEKTNTQIWELLPDKEDRLVAGSTSCCKWVPLPKSYYNGIQRHAVYGPIKDMVCFEDQIIVLEKGVLRKVDTYNGLTQVINDDFGDSAFNIGIYGKEYFLLGKNCIHRIAANGKIIHMEYDGNYERNIEFVNEDNLFIPEGRNFVSYTKEFDCLKSTSEYDKILDKKYLNWTKMEDGKIIGNAVKSIMFNREGRMIFSTDVGIYTFT